MQSCCNEPINCRDTLLSQVEDSCLTNPDFDVRDILHLYYITIYYIAVECLFGHIAETLRRANILYIEMKRLHTLSCNYTGVRRTQSFVLASIH